MRSIRCANEDNDAFVAAVTVSGERLGRSPFPSATSAGTERPFSAATELLRSAVAEVAHLDEGLDPGLAGRTLGDDEDPDGLDSTVARLGLAARPTTQGGPGGLDGVEGIGLAGPAAILAIRSVDLDDLDAHPTQVTGQARAIGTGALDADLGHVSEGLEPAQQRLVAGRIGGEALRCRAVRRAGQGRPPHGRRDGCRHHR